MSLSKSTSNSLAVPAPAGGVRARPFPIRAAKDGPCERPRQTPAGVLRRRATMPTLPTLQLKKDEDRRVLSGHLWIFSNELKTPLKGLAPGALVDVESASGTFLARGYANPKTLLCVRLLCRERRPVDRAFFKERFAAARKYRD